MAIELECGTMLLVENDFSTSLAMVNSLKSDLAAQHHDCSSAAVRGSMSTNGYHEL